MSRDVLSDLDVLDRLVQPAGKDVADIGCGPGSLLRALTARGARMIGVEISEEQLAAARRDDDGRGARYVVGRAESLPLDDGSLDAVVFMRSLHHVPPADMLDALREARRVLRPDGLVYVAEPLALGDFFELTRMVEDEVEVRAAAQRALDRALQAGLERMSTLDYDARVCLAGLDALRARIVSVDPARASRFDARQAELAEAFARLGEPGPGQAGERCFRQPMRADVLRVATSELKAP